MEAETKNPLHGRPWKNVGRFDKFEKADKVRKKYLKEKDLQAKVKKLKDNYVVKTRSTLVEPKRNKGKRKNKNFYKKYGGKE
jgi:hypothetical protein|tara:strand:- start:745 stop:990 length:246 start_codon:yes stop_codon:yes gene_type:complete